MDSLNLEEPSLASSSSMTSLGEASNMSEMSRDLASGNVAPIAARESVFKYQMALKEDQVILHQFVLTDLLGLSQVNYDFFKSSSNYFWKIKALNTYAIFVSSTRKYFQKLAWFFLVSQAEFKPGK